MFLGINYGGFHDSSIVLIDKDGTVEFAASEERFSRIKKDGRFPVQSLKHVDLQKVSHVGIPYLAGRERPSKPDPFFQGTLLEFSAPISEQSCFPSIWHERIGSLSKPTIFCDHHESHAIAGFYLSGFENALIITCDGGALNCAWNMAFYEADVAGVRPLHQASHDHFYPLCSLYSDLTAVLGYRPNVHEGKLTGLAAYASDDLDCEKAVWEAYTNLRNNNLWLCEFVGAMQTKHSAALLANGAIAKQVRQELERYTDAEIAHAVQRITEKKFLELTDKMLAEKPFENVVLAGGIFANVKLNLEVKRRGFRNIFICPPMGDEGVALGAAIAAREKTLGCGIAGKPVKDVFWGPVPSDSCQDSLLNIHVKSTPMADSHRQIAELLAAGNTLVRITGKMEFGPRALGHRSILYQATDPTVNDWLNKKLKRTEFMPFAPVVLAERASELFVERDLKGAEHTSGFMTICMECKPKFKELCPAVVHVDGTARPQLVTRENQPDLYGILLAYENLTGLPALINTSFNVHDEPIVTSYKDAVVAFFQSQLDYLALEDSIISLEDNPVWATAVECCDSPLLKDQRALLMTACQQMGNTILQLQKSKSWFESQAKSWESEANRALGIVVQQKNWIEELQNAKDWLNEQYESFKKDARVSPRVKAN